VPSVRSVIVLIRLITTRKWHGIVRPISKLTLLGSKPRKENYTLIYSSVLTIKTNTKQIATTVLSGNTDSTESSIQRNLKSSEKSKLTQFTYL